MKQSSAADTILILLLITMVLGFFALGFTLIELFSTIFLRER